MLKLNGIILIWWHKTYMALLSILHNKKSQVKFGRLLNFSGNVQFYADWICSPIYMGVILHKLMQNYSYIYRQGYSKIAYPYVEWSSCIYRSNFAYPHTKLFPYIYRRDIAWGTQNFSCIYGINFVWRYAKLAANSRITCYILLIHIQEGQCVLSMLF